MTRRRSNATLYRKSAELAIAAPQVVAHRLARMAMAGPQPSARDRREFQAMGQEKLLAFWQSWFAMGWAVTRAWQEGWLALLRGAQVPAWDGAHVLAQGLAPVHRKARANARRLARVSLR